MPSDGSAADLARDLRDHAAWARALARSLVRDDATAEDVVQDTWVAAIEHPPDRSRPLRPWLARVLRNFAFRARRSERRRNAREAAVALPERIAPSPAEVAERVETHRLLADLVADLEEPFRTTLFLHFHEDRAPSDIARLQGVPAGTVRWRLHRALELLRERLDARHGGDRAAWCALLLPIALPLAGTPAGSPSPAPLSPTAAPTAATLLGVTAMAAKTGTAPVVAALVVLLLVGLWAGGVLGSGDASTGASTLASRPAQPNRSSSTTPMVHPAPAPEPEPATNPSPETAASLKETPPAAPAPRILLRAITADGRPLADARARLLRIADAATVHDADGDGRIAIEVPAQARSSTLTVLVSAPGRASRGEVTAPLESGERDLGTWILEEGGTVHGIVVTTDGSPVEGALVGVASDDPNDEVRSERLHGAGGLTGISAETVLTGSDGTFTLPGVPARSVRLIAATRDAPAGFSGQVHVPVGATTGPVTIALPDGNNPGVLTGRVVDHAGRPVPSARVQFGYATKGVSGTGVTVADGEGRFEVGADHPAKYALAASPPHGTPGGTAVLLDVAPGTDDALLRLPEPRLVRVIVRDPAGNLVPDAIAAVLLPEPLPPLVTEVSGEVAIERIEEVTSDDPSPPQPAVQRERVDGDRRERATIDVPSFSFRLRVMAPEFDATEFGPYDPASVGERIEVVLQPLAAVRGTVAGADGPLPGAAVTLHEVHGPRALVFANGFRTRSSADAVASGRTDAAGAFRLTLRSAGTFLLRVEAAGLAPAEVGPFEIDPRVGLNGIAVRATSGGSIEGRVTAPAGASAAGTIVGLSRGDGFAFTVRADASGVWLRDRLTPGPWEVRLVDAEITPSEYSVTARDVRTPTAPPLPFNVTVLEGAVVPCVLEIPDEVRAEVTGRVRIDGAAATTGTVRILPAGTHDIPDGAPRSLLDAEGSFRIAARAPGSWRIVIENPLGRDVPLFLYRDMDVSAGETPWEIDLRTGAVEGTCDGVTSESPALLLHRMRDGTVVLAPLEPGDDGSFRASRFPAGSSRIVVPFPEETDPLAWRVLAELEVPEGGVYRVK